MNVWNVVPWKFNFPKPSIKRFRISILWNTRLHITNYTQQSVSVRSVAEEVLSDLQTNCINFTCIKDEHLGKKFTIQTVINIIHKNKQRKVNDSVRKEQVTDFTKRQRKYLPVQGATKTLKEGVKYI